MYYHNSTGYIMLQLCTVKPGLVYNYLLTVIDNRNNSIGIGNACIFGVSLSEPNHMRSTVKSVFLLARYIIPYMAESH